MDMGPRFEIVPPPGHEFVLKSAATTAQNVQSACVRHQNAYFARVDPAAHVLLMFATSTALLYHAVLCFARRRKYYRLSAATRLQNTANKANGKHL